MLKVLNISTLLLFVCFLFAPTVTYAIDADVDTLSIIVNEEEENNSKTKTKNNNSVAEEEEKEVNYYTFEKFRYLKTNSFGYYFQRSVTNHTLKDDLVFKIPSPPPEHKL